MGMRIAPGVHDTSQVSGAGGEARLKDDAQDQRHQHRETADELSEVGELGEVHG